MKAGGVIALLFLSALPGLSQGQVVLNNRVAGAVVAPVFGPEPGNPELAKHGNTDQGTPASTQKYSGFPLAGFGYTAQLFGGTTNTATTDLQAFAPPTSFLQGELSGFVLPPDFPVTVPNVPEGVAAKLQLRVWDNNGGSITNWQQVRSNGWVLRGESLPFVSRPLGNTLVLPPNLEGLQSFNLSLSPGFSALLPAPPTNLLAATVSSGRIDLSWQGNGSNTLGYRVEAGLDGLSFIAAGATSSNVFTFSSTGLRPGIRYYYRVRATNHTGESAFSNISYASTLTPFGQWQLTNFTPAQLTNWLVSGESADPDGDGLGNFAEYAFIRSPHSADADRPGDAAIEVSPTQFSFLSITYARSKVALDATFRAAVSSNQVTWESGSNVVTGPIPVSSSGDTVVAKFRDNTPVTSSGRRFLRLDVAHMGLRDSWETNAAMPIPLDEVACGIIGRRLFVVGGGNAATLAFDFVTGTWTNVGANRPFPGNHHAAEVFGGRLFLFGGLGAGSPGRVQIYDPPSNAWSAGAPMPFGAGSSASAVISNYIYVAGGIVGSSTTNGVARYDPMANSWTSMASMPLGRNHAASASDGSLFYVFGGRGAGNALANGSDTVQIYDPTSNSWRSSLTSGLAALPQARGGMGKAVFFSGEFYVLGGETSSGTGATPQRVYNRVDIYHAASNQWRLGTPMLTARHGIFPVLEGVRIYVAGGGIVSGASSSTLLETYIAPY